MSDTNFSPSQPAGSPVNIIEEEFDVPLLDFRDLPDANPPAPERLGTLFLEKFTVGTSILEYRFTVPKNYFGNATIRLFWTKFQDTDQSGNFVNWKITYSSYDALDGAQGNPLSGTIFNALDSYDSNHTGLVRNIYITETATLPNFTPGATVILFIEATDPAPNPALVSPCLHKATVMYKVKTANLAQETASGNPL